MSLRGKRILITAGPTWVPIDNIRIIGNIASGQTGALLAQHLLLRGARVTLLLGPCNEYKLDKSIRVIRFHFFNELKNILTDKLKANIPEIADNTPGLSTTMKRI